MCSGHSTKEKDLVIPSRYNSYEELFKQELENLSNPWDTERIKERINELLCQEQRLDSCIASNLILKQSNLFHTVDQMSQLSKNVSKAHESVQTMLSEIQHLNKSLFHKRLELARVLQLKRKTCDKTEYLVILQKMLLLRREICNQLEEKQFVRVIRGLLQLEKLAMESESFLFKGELVDMMISDKLKKLSDDQWKTVYEVLVNKLYSKVFETVETEARWTDMSSYIYPLSFFKIERRAGQGIIDALRSIVAKVAKKCILDHNDLISGCPRLLNEDVSLDEIEVVDICTLISSPRCESLVIKVASEFWKIFLGLVKLRYWCKSKLKQLERRNSNASKAYLNYISQMLENLSEGQIGLLDEVKKYFGVVIKASLFVKDISSQSLINITIVTQRFCLEMDLLISEKTDGISLDQLEVHRLWSSTYCSDLLEICKKSIVDQFNHSLFVKHLTELQLFLTEDSWERLPVSSISLEDYLKGMKQDKHADILKYVFWESYPKSFDNLENDCNKQENKVIVKQPASWWIRRNPFSKFEACSSRFENNTDKIRASLNRKIENPEASNFDHKNISNEAEFQAVHKNTENDIELLRRCNQGPVMSTSSRQICKYLNTYFELTKMAPFLTKDTYGAAVVIFVIFTYSILCLFTQAGYLDEILIPLSIPAGCVGGPKLHAKHATYLRKKKFPLIRMVAGAAYESLFKGKDPKNNITALEESFFIITKNHKEQEELESNVAESVILPAKFLLTKFDKVSQIFEGFHISSFYKLCSPGFLWGLAEKVTAVESCVSVLKEIDFICRALHKNLLASGVKSPPSVNNKFLNEFVSELRNFVYSDLLDFIFQMETVKNSVRSIQWTNSEALHINTQAFGTQYRDLLRRIACCGGGSIPEYVQFLLREKIMQHVIRSCVLALSGNPNSLRSDTIDSGALTQSGGSNEISKGPLLWLPSFFKELLQIIQKEQMYRLSTNEYNKIMEKTFDTSYLDEYIQAHSLPEKELMKWCKSMGQTYEVKDLVQIIRKVQYSTNHAITENKVAELELFYAEYLTTESVRMTNEQDKE